MRRVIDELRPYRAMAALAAVWAVVCGLMSRLGVM